MLNKIKNINSVKYNFVIICILAFLQGLVFYGPISTLYRQSRGIAINQIFLTESILLVTMILFEVPFGYFTDRYGYKTTLIFSSFMLFISKILFFIANSFMFFLIQSIISGIAFAGFSGCNEAFIYDCDSINSEKKFGMYSATGTVGFFIACFMSSFLSSFSLELPALITILPFGLAFILCFFIKDIDYENNQIKFSSIIKELKQIRKIFVFILSIALITEVSHGVCTFLNQIQFHNCNIDTKYFGIISAICQLGCISSSIVYKFTKKFGQFTVLLSIILIICLNILLLIFTNNWIISVVTIIIINACSAMIIPISMDIENKSITKNRATMLSIYSMFSSIIASMINIIIGKYANISIDYGFVFCLFITVLSFFTLVLYNKIKE